MLSQGAKKPWQNVERQMIKRILGKTKRRSFARLWHKKYIFKNVADGSDEGNKLFVLNKIADFWASPTEVFFFGR